MLKKYLVLRLRLEMKENIPIVFYLTKSIFLVLLIIVKKLSRIFYTDLSFDFPLMLNDKKMDP